MKKSIYICQSCGFKSLKWLGQCPDCGNWHTLTEEPIISSSRKTTDSLHSQPLKLSEIQASTISRINTGINEIDRVLGGGITKGSVILLGGEPGIGKSTLVMQILLSLCSRGHITIYFSGEESLSQIKYRAERLGLNSENFLVSNEIIVENILEIVKRYKPAAICVDSIQTVHTQKLESSPGSVSQIRESAYEITKLCKELDIAVFFIGHITKEGSFAGPKVLEHIVDCVLYFEGESNYQYRIIRAFKNRFGTVNELGIFQMTGEGLKEVSNPSQLFLNESAEKEEGSVIYAGIEGTRPILLEIQALVSKSHIAIPRRSSLGFDNNRLAMLLAVMERNLGLVLYDKDIFVNAVGGFKISEPAADLAVVLAIYSSYMELPVLPELVVFGEVGLTGEIRGVTKPEIRINEAMRLGYRYFVMPQSSMPPKRGENFFGIKRISDIRDFLLRK